jgi:endoplasmic reticulum resident protein 44
MFLKLLSVLILEVVVLNCIEADVIQLTSSNLDQTLATNELVFVNFYADWCRFSQMLSPIFEEASKKVKSAFPDDGKVSFGRIDCDREGELASRFHVSKYPTLKMFRYGSLVKREYRGQRSADALADYVRSQLNVPVTTLTAGEAMYNIDVRKRSVIGHYDNFESSDYTAFLRVASLLRDDCTFYSIQRSAEPSQDDPTTNKVVFRGPGEYLNENVYPGPLSDHTQLLQWANELCVPLVRELTFENAEELTEEGLPFLILFHHPDDTDTPERFRRIVAAELVNEKGSVNFLVANGQQFTHPLHHLGKTTKDLPVLAIDSFRHMYVWSHRPQDDIDRPGLLKQFIADLNSGKLHREFHQGPDPTPPPVAPSKEQAAETVAAGDTKQPGASLAHIPKEADSDESTEKQATRAAESLRTSPPESLFRKLAPSRTRYTILRDEL